jgi:lipopolysaccharide export system protein LptA
MKKRRLAVYGLSLVATLLLLAALYFFKEHGEKGQLDPFGQKGGMVIRGFVFTSEKEGRVDWRIKADRAEKSLDGEEVYLERLEGEYSPKDGVLVSFRGAGGKIDLSSGRCSVSSPRLSYDGEYHFEMDEIEIDLKESVAHTTSLLSVSGSSLDLKGQGLLGRLKEGLIAVERNVKGSILTDNGRYRFETERFTYDARRGTFLLEGKTRIQGQGMNMVCERLSLLKRGAQVERMEAEGGVRIAMEGIVATSGNALFDLKEEKIYLTESPRIAEGQLESKGDAIIYDRKTGSYLVKGPKVKIER